MPDKKILTQKELENIYIAFEHYFPENTVYSAQGEKSFRAGSFEWGNKKDFIDQINELIKDSGVKIKSEQDIVGVREAQKALAKIAVASGEVETTVPKAQLDTLQKEEEIKSQKVKEIKERNKQEVDNTIKRKQEIAESQRLIKEQINKAQIAQKELNGKKLYAKVVLAASAELTPDEQQAYEKLKSLAQTNPLQLQEDLSHAIEESLPENVKNSSIKDEIKLYTDYVATETVENLRKTTITPEIETAIIATASNNESLLNSLSADTQKTTAQALKDTAALKLMSYQSSAGALDMVLGPNIRQLILGTSPGDLSVTFSPSPEGANYELDLGKLNQSYQETAKNPLFSLAKDQARNRVYQIGQRQLFSRLETLPKNTTLSKAIASKEFQAIRLLTKPYTTFEFIGAEGFAGKIGGFVFKFSPESAPLLSGFGKLVGIDFGITQVTTKVATEAVKTAVTTTTKVAVEGAAKAATSGGIATAITAAFAWTGPLAPVIGTVGAFLVSVVGAEVVKKVISKAKDFVSKYGKVIVGGLGALAGFFLGGIGGGIFGGLVSYGGVSLLTGGFAGAGASIGSLWSGLGAMTSFIWSTFLAGVGTPIIATMLSLPIVVALMLLIINSGAYIVPPSPLTLATVGKVVSPYIDVKKEIIGITGRNGQTINYDSKNGIPNENLPVTVNYKVTITAKRSALTNVVVTDDCRVRKDNASVTCPSPNPAVPSSIEAGVSPTESTSFEFSMNFSNLSFADSRVTNTITVTADTPEEIGVTSAGSASLKIGNPPEDCPSDWPVYPEGGEPYLRVTQGPHTTNGTHNTIEAIDIYGPLGIDFTGHTILATHGGIATVGSGGNYGTFVDITAECDTGQGIKEVTTRYAHLAGVKAVTGRAVSKDDVIGIGGSSGPVANNAHLHYEFRPDGVLPMRPDFIPVTIRRGCSDYTGPACGVTYR